MPVASPEAAIRGLLLTVFQQLRQRQQLGVVVAFSSARSGAGVTHTVEALLAGLARDPTRRTLAVDARDLRELGLAAGDPLGLCATAAPPGAGGTGSEMGLHLFRAPGPQDRGGDWRDSCEYRRDVVQRFRGDFDYTLIDCPSMHDGNDLLALAPFVDAVILVVEAARTRREQVLHAERAIEAAGGRLLGHILNKHASALPDWLLRRW